ncbi:MAG: PBP1A family penicillin-binding protein [Spirochaetales bacterium]|uniref:peptidoglycan glycosyltransferase n=1 Tax=Candidatus Thalassospirochaeta sargassi TaxID=3119039 RepID=A0AAJ1ICD9_9SPIO|nr:PBP1A family penicillin-binding protein [Spirochaetales bacterium]
MSVQGFRDIDFCPYSLTKSLLEHTVIDMVSDKKKRRRIEIILALCIILSVIIGVVLGRTLSEIRNMDIRADLQNYEPALPSQILDRNGNLITELFSDEKREIVPVDELPKHLLYALLSREDQYFYEHNGMSWKHFMRSLYNIVAGNYFSGFSTLTMQVAGAHYADRTEITVTRKIKEVWYAYQIEKALTKNEILGIYINEVYFGHGTYGVESASQFYFGHSAREITLAEAAILVIQLASPALYSPINHPDTARARQIDVLDAMVELGYCSREEADSSFTEYWENFDYSRSNIASAYIGNDSLAPYFSEYVRLELNDMLYGAVDVNKDGYIVHTTLDLDIQSSAQKIMDRAYREINQKYQDYSDERYNTVNEEYVNLVDLLSLTFNIGDIRVTGAKQKSIATNTYYEEINPTLNMLSSLFGLGELNSATVTGYNKDKTRKSKETVEGALITLENNTGRILAMIGGSDFETKQYNRAIDATVQPGSCIKPLYYSAAISSRKFTTATRLYDGPVVFYDESGNPYEPLNFLGNWSGSVRLRYALATSMNVPSIQVLEGIGFDAAIERISRMTGLYDKRNDEVLFPRGFPLGLGVTALAPINMARAFATFPNQGKEVEPIAIISVEDRQGNIVLEPEKERLREKQKNNGEDQIMTPQEAYIMTDMLQSTVEYGTLANRRRYVGGFDGMPMAGKTGTTQNWQDAWTVGFSPYYTTAVWFGFDTPGTSLGRGLTGATAAGPYWALYMKEIHTDLERIEFPEPDSGLIRTRVCSVSGLLPTNDCDEGTVEELFLVGTEPRQTCDIHKFEKERDQELLQRLQDNLLIEDVPLNAFDVPQLELPDFLIEFDNGNSDSNPAGDNGDYNPLLD